MSDTPSIPEDNDDGYEIAVTLDGKEIKIPKVDTRPWTDTSGSEVRDDTFMAMWRKGYFW